MPSAVDLRLMQLRDLLSDAVRAGDTDRMAELLGDIAREYGETDTYPLEIENAVPGWR